ncbi:MAG: 4-(cytidine 5'-diphospho)-2-C-methyl-D-erythritol kinase [Steroidobacteraceae bacterium]
MATLSEPVASRRWWPAPAKLNLFLHVVGRRDDGYHELQTAYQLLDWGDELSFELLDEPRIECRGGPAGVAAEDDLAWRAAMTLREHCRVQRGASITLRKRIPVGGGLGGGSSDAATVLRVLNHAWNCGLTRAELARLGLGLGADVPVFIEGYSAFAEGLGERLTPIDLPERWFVIIHPRVALSTREVFHAPDLTRNSPLITIRAFFESGGRNDCELVVRRRYPAVAEALDWLGDFGPARLTGTGSCVFLACTSWQEAERVAARVPDRWQSFVARGVRESPLQI